MQTFESFSYLNAKKIVPLDYDVPYPRGTPCRSRGVRL